MRGALLALVVAGCAGQFGVGLGGPVRTAPPPQPTAAPRAGVGVALSFDIQFYGLPLGGADDLVFVLDRSGSMDGGKLDGAKAELLGVLDRLPDGTRVGLVFFNTGVAEWTLASVAGATASDVVGGDSATRWLAGASAALVTRASGADRRLVALSPLYRRHAYGFIGSIDASGSTAAVPALRAAASMGARHIVFLSDGLANTDGDGGELMSLAADCGRQGVRIDTVGLGEDQDFQVLQTMAASTGGTAVVRP
jgi:secreted protein with Ig-like and vWFA domain